MLTDNEKEKHLTKAWGFYGSEATYSQYQPLCTLLYYKVHIPDSLTNIKS